MNDVGVDAPARWQWVRAHRKTSVAGAAASMVLLAVVVLAATFNGNRLRPVISRSITAHTGREATIDGNLTLHLLSWTPSVQIERLSLKNPAWAANPVMFSAERISLTVTLLRLLRGQIVLPELVVTKPVIDLERDAQGRASWEFDTPMGKPSRDAAPMKLPVIRRLIIQQGQVHVKDQIRKLEFGGTLTAADGSAQAANTGFQVQAHGTLNEKPFQLDVHGAPLLNLAPDTPYACDATIVASDIHLGLQLDIPKPFDFSTLNVKFSIHGHDLADVYYLTGLALPNTPPYQLHASIGVSGNTYRIDDLKGRLGSSDLSGRVEVVNRKPRPLLTARLSSDSLNLADVAPTLGHPAGPTSSLSAGEPGAKGRHATPHAQTPVPQTPPAQSPAAQTPSAFLFPDADLQVNRVRGMDADVHFHASSVTAPNLPLKSVNFHLVLNDGVLSLDPLSFVMEQGTFAGRVQIDAHQAVPVTDIDMNVRDVNLAEFKGAKMQVPPLSGSLLGRIQLHGTGTSLHKVASSADGSVSLVIPQGDMTSAFAELTGIDVMRGLGLLLGKPDQKTAIRCSVMDFKAHQGELAVNTLFVDTTNVLITGRGDSDLKTEKLDMQIKGEPKKVRLTRVRSPITVEGTLRHPSIGVDVKKLAAQGAVATALGVLLTPVAAVLAFVDPGLAHDKDCTGAMSNEAAGRAGNATLPGAHGNDASSAGSK